MSIRGFGRDQRGNIGMMFALMSSALFMFLGGALDYTRWNAIRADMLESMDAASLAVAQIRADNENLPESELEAFGDQFFLENFNYENAMQPGWAVTFDVQNSGNIRTCMSGAIGTYLLRVTGIAELDMDKCVEITPQGAGRIELALVLDVTGSMGWSDSSGANKMTSLKNSVTELLDVLYDDGQATSDNVRISVVPFNQHVNVGGAASWNDTSWGDQDAKSFYHGARFFHVDSSGAVDMNTKVNHYDLYNSDPNSSWGGCVEARPYPLDEMDTVPGVSISSSEITSAIASLSYSDEPNATMREAFANAPSLPNGLTATMLASADNSRFVPVFLPDEPDCYNSGCDYDDSGETAGYNWHGYWFDNPDHVWGHTQYDYRRTNGYNRYINDYRYTRPEQGTPFEKYVPVAYQIRHVLSGDVSNNAFKEWMSAYGATDYGYDEFIARTGYVGWWDSASQTYKHKYDLPKNSVADGPNPYNCPPAITPLTNVRKTIEDARDALYARGATNIPVGVVWGWRTVSPQAPFTEAIGPGETGVDNTTEADWSKAVVIMTDGENFFGTASTHWESRPGAFGYAIEERMGSGVNAANSGTPNMVNEADDKLLRICRRMKQDEILVYTIVFDVSEGSTIDTIMKACASEPKAPFFYNAADGVDLKEAFGLIAADLVKLHVSR